MTYTLHRLAPGSYDLCLDGELIGGVVRTSEHRKTWIAELLVDAPPEARPRPFTELSPTCLGERRLGPRRQRHVIGGIADRGPRLR
jgi:hypothetical protein